ncbi:His-Xaa-Ser system radical SAM maturase HxsC [Janthinobacterium sp.]|uniref:His-Xaa-Ser system radical SAM maturase HxsC n=1 Tax=Janthinobacterium sp. TaxID=1871054 RepID=UPI00258EA123|nr:His-Xaa-Ser system radical SAM maturase HxsC [Janthinobacterium sp.]MCX7289551.1 His-Xaa-Ser system radical SAM maturase HxsC [Janthinobacterium sp.]
MRRFTAKLDVDAHSLVHRVVILPDLACDWAPDLRYLVQVSSEDEERQIEALRRSGLNNIWQVSSTELIPGDIVTLDVKKSQVFVLYRESDSHHSLLLTNRCNSYCIMCSQPPTKHDDSWLVEEVVDVIRHLRLSPPVLGLSGGEPLLLGADLRRILDVLHISHPSTRVEVLTNGRLFSDANVVDAILKGLQPGVQWLVPLYGHADFFHDFVVQSSGAFEQTLSGLLALQEYEQATQLRIVLVETVLQSLEELCSFIGRNLPFVKEVALMACEPTGFALANREQCELDLLDWTDALLRSSSILRRYSVPHLFMNAPLCALPTKLRSFAHKSISDWKNVYVQECESCSAKDKCSGLFSWHEKTWTPTRIRAIEELMNE